LAKHASDEGHVNTLEELVTKYDRRLFRIAYGVTHNREDAEDVVQESFLKAYQHLADFRGASQLSTWLIRITVNEALTKLRKRRTAREVSVDADFEADSDMRPLEVVDWAPNPEQSYRASELREILTGILEELEPVSRTVFVLRDIEGLTTDETTAAMNMSISAVKARLWRVRLQIRQRLNTFFAKRNDVPRTENHFVTNADSSIGVLALPPIARGDSERVTSNS
jgi:RNA polymerase sigma-70 factor (ECF subfamily)